MIKVYSTIIVLFTLVACNSNTPADEQREEQKRDSVAAVTQKVDEQDAMARIEADMKRMEDSIRVADSLKNLSK